MLSMIASLGIIVHPVDSAGELFSCMVRPVFIGWQQAYTLGMNVLRVVSMFSVILFCMSLKPGATVCSPCILDVSVQVLSCIIDSFGGLCAAITLTTILTVDTHVKDYF